MLSATVLGAVARHRGSSPLVANLNLGSNPTILNRPFVAAILPQGENDMRLSVLCSLGIFGLIGASASPALAVTVIGTKANIGYSNVVSGSYSSAFGRYTSAGGQYSAAFGHVTHADGYASAAFGHDTHAGGSWSASFGYKTQAVAKASATFGHATVAQGNYSVAFGNQSIAHGQFSAAFGEQSQAIGSYSSAFGWNTVAIGDYSTAFGDSCRTHGDHSMTSGVGLEAESYASVVIGSYNSSGVAEKDENPYSTSSWVADEPLFVIGNGTASNDRRNALVILKSGATAINGATSINGDTAISGDTLVVGDTQLTGTLTSLDLTGSDTAYVCVDSNGTIFRSPSSCGPVIAEAP